MSFVGPVLHQKQKSSLFEGLKTRHLKVGSARRVSGTHFEWNVHLGNQIPVHVIKVPCTAVSFAPHLAHNSCKLSLASSISAAIVAPSQPRIKAPIKSTPCSNLFANWNENIKLNWCRHLLLKLNRVGERLVMYTHGEYPTITTVPLNSMLCHNCCQCCWNRWLWEIVVVQKSPFQPMIREIFCNTLFVWRTQRINVEKAFLYHVNVHKSPMVRILMEGTKKYLCFSNISVRHLKW